MPANTPIVLHADDVARLLPQLDIQSTLRQMFTDLAQQRAVQPPQSLTLFPGGAGDVITYQGVMASGQVFGAKLSPYIVTGQQPVITAWTLLMSMQSGQPLLLCDAARLTTERTAATTALAIDLLARPGARRLAIIGSGKLAMAHLHHAATLRDWSAIRVYSPSLEGDTAAQQLWQQADPRLHLCHSTAEAVRDADVVMLCTSSAAPVVQPDMLSPHALVTSISTNALHAHEIPPAALAGMDVYCDDRHSTPASAGEMVLAARDHGWQASAIRGDLAELTVGRAALPAYDKPVFFRSIGMGLEDIAIAHALLQHLAG